MRAWILRMGLRKAVIYLIITIVVSSNLLNAILMLAVYGRVASVSIVNATLVPLVLGGPLLAILLRLVFELEEARERMRQLSITDELTQSHNRRYFLDCLERELAGALRNHTIFSVIMLDLDAFKQVNDRYGHNAGDQMLAEVAALCRNQSRAGDLFARFGGDEFIFLLPQTGHSAARAFAERIRYEIERFRLDYREKIVGITASLGVCVWEPGLTDSETIILRADGALYDAKWKGKNCVVVAGE